MLFGMPWPGPEVAREAEDAGVAAFCTGDFVDHDAYVTLAEMVANTERAQVGTGIAYAHSRSPYAHASALRTLHKRAPGRLFCGLGSAAFTINRDWLGVAGERPVERMTETIGAVRAWLHAENGERVQYDGDIHHVDAAVGAPVLGRLDVPVLLAAFNTRMARAATHVGDGLIGHGLFTDRWWDEVVRPAADKGAGDAGRDQRPVEHGWIITAINDEEPERAVLDARRMIAFYLTVKTYDPFVAHHGWEGPVKSLRAAFKAGDTDGMAAAVTDEMLSAIAVCGTTRSAREMLAARAALPRDVGYFAAPSFLVGNKRQAAYARAALALTDALPA
jgi:alkanesulfonate monooxygenase SsuD/methylene tetrahydromethanopterin reductase-like flavin-dependent oxidoreductase (luciferase family)